MNYKLGWHPELPDFRDLYVDSPVVMKDLRLSKPLTGVEPLKLGATADLREWCSPIEDQDALGSCTAQAAVALVEYLEKRVTGKHLDGSRLFVYKVTRNLLGWKGDTGAYVRTTLHTLAKFGVCPERYWPYMIEHFEEEPPAFCYAYAQTARAQRYFRLDHAGADRNKVLMLVKVLLSRGLPCTFGFVVYDWGNDTGEFMMPGKEDRPQGGHAIMAVGFDDSRKIGESVGALLIRNSWGTGWGDNGYGWLPYDYILHGLAADFWVISRQDFIDD